MRKYLVLFSALSLLGSGSCLMGCSIPLAGAGTIKFGLEMRNLVVMEHSVDGDKEGITSRSSIEADPLLDRLFSTQPSADGDGG